MLMFRRPFDEKRNFIELRKRISALIEEMVDIINNPNSSKFFSVPQVLLEKGNAIEVILFELFYYFY